jgi:carboxypeptidase Q
MVQRFRTQQAISGFVYTQNPLAVIDRGTKGDYGTIFVSGAAVPAPPPDPDADFMSMIFNRPQAYGVGAPETAPQFTIAVEHYNRIVRQIDLGIKVTMDVMLNVEWNDDDPMEYNLTGEIQGTDPEIGDEVVMLGGHFDSWHAGTGAVDNAAGSAVSMEAMRILKAVYAAKGTGPRRTIRIGLWTGEEQGLLGSGAYVADHFAVVEGRFQPPTALKPEHDKLSGYYNYDNGTGKIRGVYMQGNAAVEPIFRAWLAPFHDLGAATLTISDTGGTDHLAFDGVGLPGFQFIQDEIAYSPKNHHSNMDVYDHAIPEDLMQSAVIMAAFVYHTAERDEMLPRKPVPVPPTVAPSTGSR